MNVLYLFIYFTYFSRFSCFRKWATFCFAYRHCLCDLYVITECKIWDKIMYSRMTLNWDIVNINKRLLRVWKIEDKNRRSHQEKNEICWYAATSVKNIMIKKLSWLISVSKRHLKNNKFINLKFNFLDLNDFSFASFETIHISWYFLMIRRLCFLQDRL